MGSLPAGQHHNRRRAMGHNAAVKREHPRLGGNDLPSLGHDASFGAHASLVSIVVKAAPDDSDEPPAHAATLSISVSPQPPCTVPIGLSRCEPGSPSNAAKASPISTIQSDIVCEIGA